MLAQVVFCQIVVVLLFCLFRFFARFILGLARCFAFVCLFFLFLCFFVSLCDTFFCDAQVQCQLNRTWCKIEVPVGGLQALLKGLKIGQRDERHGVRHGWGGPVRPGRVRVVEACPTKITTSS
jgi:hypothetical protein